MHPYLGEFIGTALLILMGNGVVANVVLEKTKGNGSGWIVITFGWAMAVFLGVYTAKKFGGSGHLNPAVTIALAFFKGFDKSLIIPYVLAQVGGAMLGSVLVWLAYRPHFRVTQNKDLKLACFCTSPAMREKSHNIITEFIGTFVLVFGALSMSDSTSSMGTLDALPVALLVLGIGLSLGGPTGYAINPARDFGPRLMYTILPIPGKRDSDWSYSWIPIVGPLAGGILAAYLSSFFG